MLYLLKYTLPRIEFTKLLKIYILSKAVTALEL